MIRWGGKRMRTRRVRSALVILASVALFAACSGGGGAPVGVTFPQPTPTDTPWPEDWEASVCLAHKQSVDSLTHFKAAGEALQAYDADVATEELTDAAHDAQEVGDYLAGTTPWKAGQAFFNALTTAGLELRKAAGLSKLALTGDATVRQVTKQTKVATAAFTKSEIEYASLTNATGFECGY
jgi:hypothetical protein